jgi:ubiquinone/menaquinone biosynthesis C-methylase UbiE
VTKIMDIACGEGLTCLELKKLGKAKEVIGVELFNKATKIAESRLDQVICGNIEEINLPFETGYFNYIIMSLVIEHLINPWKTLKRLRNFLSIEGYLIACISNIAHWRTLKDLIVFDNWEYKESSFLDKTHLRFFTKKTILKLFNEGNYEVKSITEKISNKIIVKAIDSLTYDQLRRFFISPYLIMAQKRKFHL